jgi:ketosteroid isomerase-like protein
MDKEIQAILTANKNFYMAFADSSSEVMDILWSNSENISCIHPGWPPLYGREDVIDSWHCILDASPPIITFSRARAHIHGNFGYVICCEHMDPGILLATNIFAKEADGWKMVHHQASIAPSGRDEEGFEGFENFDAMDGPVTIQ